MFIQKIWVISGYSVRSCRRPIAQWSLVGKVSLEQHTGVLLKRLKWHASVFLIECDFLLSCDVCVLFCVFCTSLKVIYSVFVCTPLKVMSSVFICAFVKRWYVLYLTVIDIRWCVLWQKIYICVYEILIVYCIYVCLFSVISFLTCASFSPCLLSMFCPYVVE